MQVLSRQRGVSLITLRKSARAGTRSSGGCSAPLAMRQQVRGFTLVELLITITIAVVLIMIAVPSFQRITLSSKLTTTVNDVVGAINVARMEAIKRNGSTQLCGSANNGTDLLGSHCDETGAVYALTTASNGNADVAKVRVGATGIADPIQLNGAFVALRFSGQGLAHAVGNSAPYSGLVVDIFTDQISSDNHRCINMIAGSIIETTTTSGACP